MPRAIKKLYATGDWPCHFCGEAITERGRTSNCLIRHHLDHDSGNNEPSNIVPCHRHCHEQHHKVGKVQTIETKNKIGMALRGRPKTTEHKRKLSAANSTLPWARESNRSFRSDKHRIEKRS